ncbi:small GTP-binding protein domain-containing protein, partial [mine drainage metagenome]
QGEAWQLGVGEPVFVSALHGHGTGDLLDRIVKLLPDVPAVDPETSENFGDRLRIAIVGRPNAGKSTFVNRVLGEERMLVSDRPGTTTDAVDVHVERGGERYTLVDTAGLRRPARVVGSLEELAGRHARRAVERADIALLLVDADEGVAEQDKRILGVCEDSGSGVVIGFNKWDQTRRDERLAQTIEADFRRMLPGFHYAPIVFLSARTGWNIDRTFSQLSEVGRQHATRVST